MACRLTQEELDQQFEQFLKESVSDDSVDLGSSSKRSSVLDQLGARPQPHPKKSVVSVPWWQEGEDSVDTPGNDEASKRKYIRSKNNQAVEIQEESRQKHSPPDTTASGKTFRKSLKKSQTIQQVDEDQTKEQCFEDVPRGHAVSFRRDSLEHDDLLIMSGSAQSAAALGLHTLNEEQEEKDRFFTNMDRGAESVTKYPEMDKDQESFSCNSVSPQRENAALTEQDQSPDVEKVLYSVQDNPGSPAYSDDFEDEATEKETIEKKPERCGMLAKVSLHDSLNSTDGAPVPALDSAPVEGPDSRLTQTAGPATTVEQKSLQSGTSDVEALQEAYRQISHSEGECEEREQELSRSPFSPSSSEGLRKTLQHASTAESDLQTAEELMCAIRPDSGSTYDFCLKAPSEAVVEMESRRLGTVGQTPRTFDFSVALREVACESPVMELHQTSHDKHKSIAEEVKKLMKEQDDASKMPPVVSNKNKKPQVLGKSTSKASIPATNRKPAVSSMRNRSAEIRPLPKASTPSKTSNSAKPQSSLAQRKRQNQTSNRKSALSQTQLIEGPASSLLVSKDFRASVHASAEFLQQHIKVDSPDYSDSKIQQAKARNSESGKEGDAHRGPNLLSDLSSLERLSLQLAQRERQLDLKEEQLHLEHNKEISALKQENYMLQSKLHSMEEFSKKQKWSFSDTSDMITTEKLKQIEKEMSEQERLIQGYHLENEKLYLQMKALRAQTRLNEDALFAENQRLLSELTVAKEQLNKSSLQKNVGNVGFAIDHGHSVTELQAQVQAAQRREAILQEETCRLKQEKQALLVDLQMIKKERDLAKAHVISTSVDKGYELKLLEEKHKEEVAALNKRLQWYAENQELLDKDAVRLKAANVETQRLTEQVERLKMEVAKQASQHQKKANERAGQAKRIQDLERQVKEMEEILRRRHPNSLPALMLAAAVAGGEEGGEKSLCTASQPSHASALLERRVIRLEAELEGRDEEAKRSLRVMEQHFHRLKLQYEQQISDLEQQLADRSPEHQTSSSKKSETQSHALQDELEKLQEAHQSEVRNLKAEVASLQEQLQQAYSSAEPKKPSRHQKQAEAAQATRMDRLSQELARKSRTIQELKRTVERLQREKTSAVLSPKGQTSNAPPKWTAKDPDIVLTETFPPTQDEKDYQPKIFSGSHISEVQQENERLRARQEQLEQQWKEERITLQAAATQAHTELLRSQEHSREQLALLRSDHQQEIENLVAHHTLEHSSSKVAELTNKVKTQEVMVLHLREQLKDLQRSKEALVVSKLREETLQSQLTKLLEELKQAKEAHSPELRHFASLEHKIHAMELRYNQREQELQQMIAQTRSVVEQEQQAEVARWKALAQGKSRELEAFRVELDSILDMLRELQKQGVVIPATKYYSAAGSVFRPLRS